MDGQRRIKTLEAAVYTDLAAWFKIFEVLGFETIKDDWAVYWTKANY